MTGVSPALYSFGVQLLSNSDVQIDGTRPWDPKMNNPAIAGRILRDGALGVGEGYMDGWWDCESLDGLFYRVTKHRLDKLQPKTMKEIIKFVSDRIFSNQQNNLIAAIPIRISDIIKILSLKFFNFQTRTLSWKVNELHYNLGNELFERMLGPHMQYSCGYWKNATTFEESEEGKIRLICEKLQLEPGMRVLDIGCGFGGFAKYAAKNYGVTVTGVTLSSEQQKYGEKFCEGLDVRILLKDYRDLDGQYDRIVTVEMIEHVGPRNYATFFSIVDRCLRPNGLFLLHVIGSNEGMEKFDDWIDKYIFPNMSYPSLQQIARASEPYFIVEDVHNMGADFDKTMMAWHERFVAAWPHISHNYDARFKRMFSYYLQLAAGVFRARRLQVWHIVFSRGIEGGVCVPR